MKHNYLVIDAHGSEYAPGDYQKLKECSDEFKVVIDREALGINALDSAKKPAYLQSANKLGFQWEPSAGAGFLQYNYKADLLMRLVKQYARQLVRNIGFPVYEVRGSNFFDMDYPIVQAYASLFGDRLFQPQSGKKKMVMSYDASYPQFNIAKASNIRESNLPFAHFSLSDCYRNEQSGECMLLFRGKRFFMPDLHPYFKNVCEAFDWYKKIEDRLRESFQEVGVDFHNVVKVSSEKYFEEYKSEIAAIAKRNNHPILVEIRMDSIERYWIIDVDYGFVDVFNQFREIGCIQIDIGNAQRLDINYRGKDGKKHHPVIIHSAVPGGIERYIYMIMDDVKKRMPFWLYPVQVRFVPVNSSFSQFASELAEKYAHNLRIEIDNRDESVSKRIKQAHESLIPEVIVIGEKEKSDSKRVCIQLDQFMDRMKSKPYIPLGWPSMVSEQI